MGVERCTFTHHSIKLGRGKPEETPPLPDRKLEEKFEIFVLIGFAPPIMKPSELVGSKP